ncbi:MAG: hypothetical protein VW378_05180 [bacterium]
MKKKHLAYIIPAKAHQGLSIKFQGQQKGFASLGFQVKSLLLTQAAHGGFIQRCLAYLYFECKALAVMLRAPYIYSRYNPKAFLNNCWLLGLSGAKSIVIEHNTKYAVELRVLKQPVAAALNTFFLKMFARTSLKHSVVTEGIKEYLISYGIAAKNIVVIQNGYDLPNIKAAIDTPLLEKIQAFKKEVKKVGIFVGSGFKWHGVEDMIQLCERHKIGLVIVCPKKIDSQSKAVLNVGYQPYKVIKALYEQVDFGFSSFALEKNNLEGCPLKAREYLCHGLPVCSKIQNDCIEKIPQMKQWVFNMAKDPKALQALITKTHDKKEISDAAAQYLSWETQLKPVMACLSDARQAR